MIVILDPNDSRAIRNKDNVLALYDLMINQRKSEEATSKFVSPAYIQHNPLIADGPVALGKYFGQVTRARANPRVIANLDWTLVERHLEGVAPFEDLPDLLMSRRRTKRMSQTIEDIRRVRYKYAIANLNGGGRPDAASFTYVAPFADLDLAAMRKGKQFAEHVGVTSHSDFAAVSAGIPDFGGPAQRRPLL